jgi:simple sugar transport system substrate-binding protein
MEVFLEIFIIIVSYKKYIRRIFLMKKRILAIVMTAVMALSLAACGSNTKQTSNDTASTKGGKDVITVGFSQVGAESDWRTANTESMKSTFSEANGYELIFDDAQQKQENQIAAIRNFIQQEVDYIVLAPVTETGWDTVLKEAKDAGIPVIIVDRMVDVSDDSLYTAWVGSNFELEGKKSAAWLDAYLKAAGKDKDEVNIVDIQGTIGASAQIGRTKGLEDAVAAHSNWKLLAKTSGEFTQAKGQEVMESMLKQYGDKIDVVYCENDNEAFGAIDAIEAAGYKVGLDGDMFVMSFDCTKAGLTDTLSGKISQNTECNPLHGPRVEEIIKSLESGQTVDKKKYVDEVIFSFDDSVKSLSIDGTDYPVTKLTQEILDKRAY